MKNRLQLAVLLIASMFLTSLFLTSLTAEAQQSAAAPAAMGASDVVPSLINYTGVLKDTGGRTLTSTTGVTFLLYSAEQGGAPLWLETQNVTPDKTGRYTVHLGMTSAKGVPSDLFVSGEARWLAIQIGSETEQSRVFLVAVPYAMKAADAQTLGGLPASAFALAPSGSAAKTSGAASAASSSPASPASQAPAAPKHVTTTGGTAQHLPMFTTPTDIQNSIVTQSGATAIDVTGKLGVNTAAPSQSLDVTAGNAIVRGSGNFTKKGDTATLSIGDTSHSIEAIWGSGLAIGTYKAPQALFIADKTGNVGIGTTTPTAGILNTLANSNSVVGLSTAGWNAPSESNGNGTDAFHATGGNGDIGGQAGGAGAVIAGGTGSVGGNAVVAQGANSAGLGGFIGGDGVVATGGNSGGNGGNGVTATGGSGVAPGTGVLGIGGEVFVSFVASGGPGLVGQGNNSTTNNGGDGIDAIAGTGCCPGLSINGLAGSFTGDVHISGNLNVAGTKSFRIDHPLDPANKYLYHASLESSEVLDFYSGNTTLDANGQATVQLPNWFEALNRDFRYQLTAIGAAAPGLHIAQEIQNHSFRIAGGAAAMKVSWQVTAVRQDAWEKAHPMVVEVQKPPTERGYYINPELFGAPPEKSLAWARNPQLMKRLKDLQEKQSNHTQGTRATLGKSGKP